MSAANIMMMWLIILAVLVVIEIATMGLTTIWFAGGALVAFLSSLMGAPLWLQIVVFIAVSVILLIFTRPIAMKYMNKNVEKTNVDSIPGKIGVVTQQINNLQAKGQVMIQGMEWSARSKEDTIIENGKKVKVISVEGVKLIVEEDQ